jgi:hypothetical protein
MIGRDFARASKPVRALRRDIVARFDLKLPCLGRFPRPQRRALCATTSEIPALVQTREMTAPRVREETLP